MFKSLSDGPTWTTDGLMHPGETRECSSWERIHMWCNSGKIKYKPYRCFIFSFVTLFGIAKKQNKTKQNLSFQTCDTEGAIIFSRISFSIYKIWVASGTIVLKERVWSVYTLWGVVLCYSHGGDGGVCPRTMVVPKTHYLSPCILHKVFKLWFLYL